MRRPIIQNTLRSTVRPTVRPYQIGETETFTTATWNIIRGGTRTFDIAAQSGIGARTGWILSNPPADFTIDAAGEITATLNHLHTATPGTLEVSTNEGNIRVPTTIRDWTLSDSELPITLGFSLWKARDASQVTELFRLDILDPSVDNFPNTTLESAIIMQTDADGELDISTLENAFESHDDGIAIITQLTNIGTDSGGNLTSISGGNCVYAWKQGGGDINYFTTPSGVRAMRADWKPRDFHNTWSLSESQTHRYITENDSSLNIGNFWAMTAIARRREATSTPHAEFGDQNTYPDILENASAGNSYTATGNFSAASVTINANSGLDWIAVQGGIYPENPGGINPMMRLRLASLERNDRNQRLDNTPSNLHGFSGGYGFRLRRYDMTDLYAHDVPEDQTESYEHFDDLAQLDSYFAAKIANQNLYA